MAMKHFNETEKMLYELPRLKKALQNMKTRQERLKYSGIPKDISAIDTTRQPVSGGGQKDAFTELSDYLSVGEEIAKLEIRIENIEDVIKQMAKENKEIVDIWYLTPYLRSKDKKEKIANIFNVISDRSIYRLRNNAVGEFAMLYFGEE